MPFDGMGPQPPPLRFSLTLGYLLGNIRVTCVYLPAFTLTSLPSASVTLEPFIVSPMAKRPVQPP